MGNFGFQNSREFNIKRNRKIGNRSINRNIIDQLLHYLLVVLAAILDFSCNEKPSIVIEEDIEKEEIEIHIIISNEILNSSEIKTLDIMLYDNSGLKELSKYLHIDKGFQKEYALRIEKGEKHLVVIANSSQSLKKPMINKYESCQGLGFSYDSSQNFYPIMTGEFAIEKDNTFVIKGLTPAISKICIYQINNNLDNYELLENPRVRLLNLNSTIYPFSSGPYFPSEFIDYSDITNLQYDIGMETQYPMISLSCFPNSSKNYGMCTQLEFICEIEGKSCSYIFDLPPLERNAIVEVGIDINSSDDYDYYFR